MNDDGQVVGYDGARYVLWDNGAVTPIFIAGHSLNSAGAVAGSVGVAPGVHPAVWESGSVTDLDPTATYDVGFAAALNDAGLAVGEWHETSLSPANAALWDANGRTDVTDSYWGEAWFDDVNNSGLAIGTAVVNEPGVSWVACASWDGTLSYHSTANDWGCWPAAVNNVDQFVGQIGDILDEYGFIWNDGVFTDLGSFGYDGNDPSGLNDLGEVVGTAYGDAQRLLQGYLWRDGSLVDLNSLLPAGSDLFVASGRDINDAGQILARARRNGIDVYVIMTPPGIRGRGPSPGRAGASNTLEAIQATANGGVRFYYGTTDGSTTVLGCPGLSVDIANAQFVATTANAGGDASVELAIPSGESGNMFRFFAVDVSTCSVSNLSLHRWP
jgi:probable HAF family extracellular repeat protein